MQCKYLNYILSALYRQVGVMLLICICEVLGSNVSLVTGYPDMLSTFTVCWSEDWDEWNVVTAPKGLCPPWL